MGSAASRWPTCCVGPTATGPASSTRRWRTCRHCRRRPWKRYGLLTGQSLVVPGQDLEATGSRPHGHVAAVHTQAKALDLPALLGPAGRDRDIALALIIARVCRPGSKPATTRWWSDTTLADDLGVADATTDEVYAAMDWLQGRQYGIETKLVRTHLAGPANPDRLALFDLVRGLPGRDRDRLGAW